MLGQYIYDPDNIEGKEKQIQALGMLNVSTTLTAEKSVKETQATHVITGTNVIGYEIHLGLTKGKDNEQPFAMVKDKKEGAVDPSQLVSGTYLHGLFADDTFRKAFLAELGRKSSSSFSYHHKIDEVLDKFAHQLEKEIDILQIQKIMGI